MTPRSALMVSALLLLPWTARAQTTSTLAAETGDNTSVGTFAQNNNGNVAAGNVSKLDLHTLLYPGATTRIYAHVMPWFCTPGSANCNCSTTTGLCNSHFVTGYNSNDAAQVKKQVDDMISRGVQGAIIPWYGSTKPVQSGATSKLLQEAQSRTPLFELAMMETSGSGCTTATDKIQCVIDDLNHFATNFYASPAYMRRNGRPVVFLFTSTLTGIDWTKIRCPQPSGQPCATGNPLFVFESNGTGSNPFTVAQSDGGFAWVHPNPTMPTWTQPDFISYLDQFYGYAQSNSGKIPVGAGFKGFRNTDIYQAWNTNERRMDQVCGQTWLQSFGTVQSNWSSSDQLDSLQLVTWNDYDEGTEIESGIDNCLSISASLGADGKTLSWSLSGSGEESTVDRYRIWSTPASDGQNLTLRAEVTAGGAHSYDLSTLPLSAGSYTIYVQALGKPTILNHMANGVSYAAVGGPNGCAASNVDDAAGWQSCTSTACCGGGGGATTALTADPSKSQNGSGVSARFDLGGSTAYSNARWWNQVATTCAAFHFTLDFWAYVTAPSAPQGFEFDFDQVVGGQRYKFSHQCDFKDSGLWRVWANGGWTATSHACVPFTANSWNHFVFHGERTLDGRVHYQDMVINNVTYTFDLYATPTAAGSDSVTVYIQLDGNSQQTPYSLWIDKLSLTSQ
jgi:hypothetical protein